MAIQLTIHPSRPPLRVVPLRSYTSQTEHITTQMTRSSTKIITTVTTSRHDNIKVVNRSKKKITTTTTSDGLVVLNKTSAPRTFSLQTDGKSNHTQSAPECGDEQIDSLMESKPMGTARTSKSSCVAGSNISGQKKSGHGVSHVATKVTETPGDNSGQLAPHEKEFGFRVTEIEYATPRTLPSRVEGDWTTQAWSRPGQGGADGCSQLSPTLHSSSLDYRRIWDIGQYSVRKTSRKKITCYKDYLDVY